MFWVEIEERRIVTQAWKVVDGVEWRKGRVVSEGRRWIGREVSGRRDRIQMKVCCDKVDAR